MNVICCILLFFLSFILTYVVKVIAVKKSIIDIPVDRSSHTVPTPRGGGLAIAIVWFAALLYLFFDNRLNKDLFFALISGIVLVIVSLLDDIYDLKPVIRIGAQFISAVSALYFLGGMQTADFGLFSIGNVWILTVTALIGIIWFVNLYNFSDGIDGYAASEAVFISLMFYLFTGNNLYLILTAAVSGFLVWNWQPAKIFMGDVGSTLLGFNFAVLAIYEQNTQNISIVIFLIVSSLFWFDATFTLFRRWKNKEKLGTAHKKHAYQRLTQAGYSHAKTVILSFVLNIIAGIAAYFSFLNPEYIIPVLGAVILMLFVAVKFIDEKKPF